MLGFKKEVVVEMAVAAALALRGMVEQGGNNKGQAVELFLKEVGLKPGLPWCAAMVHHVGYWALYDVLTGKSRWPLPATGSCLVLGNYALSRDVLVKTPERGDLFLDFDPKKDGGRFAHTGFVLHVHGKPQPDGSVLCTTLEGNTSPDGSPEGYGVFIRQRPLNPVKKDRFVRWAALLDPEMKGVAK